MIKRKITNLLLLTAAMVIGGISGVYLLVGFKPLNVVIFALICGGIGKLWELIQKYLDKNNLV